jgi:hypothetical protein
MPDDDTELTVVEDSLPTTLFGTNDPDQLIEIATAKAKALAKVVKAQKLSNKIGGREHVRVEGWELLGSLTGVFPVLEWSRPLENGWEARVEAKTRSGEIVGAAEAMCTRDEKTWSTRDEYALRSMAQTRATSKALRQPLGFIMVLAGYDPTPADEMAVVVEDAPAPVSKTLTREMVVQRIVDRAKEHDIQPEILGDVIDSAYQGKTIDDLTKDELVQLGTDIAAGKYDLPFESAAGPSEALDTAAVDKPEQATEAARGTGAAPLKGNPAPVTQPAEPSPLESPPADIQAVLDLTGGTLEQPAPVGEAVAARRASAPAADGIAERVEKARKRAGVTA